MTREEEVRERTVKRFLECEAKRAEAHAAALAAGKDEYDARDIAHEAAKAHWNAWAKDMLEKRRALEQSGVWAATKFRGSLEPVSAEARAWMEQAEANFSRCLFLIDGDERTEMAPRESEANWLSVKSIVSGTRVNMCGFVFPGTARFSNATFSGEVLFDSAAFNGNASFGKSTFARGVYFSSATFECRAVFEETTFYSDAYFTSTTFAGDAYFRSATFKGTFVSFDGATFRGAAEFFSATFEGYTSFADATFKGTAKFIGAAFKAFADFSSATFEGAVRFTSGISGRIKFLEKTSFAGASFLKSTSFRDALFAADTDADCADFTAIKVERAFDLTGAHFSKVPNFSQADFKQAPDLDGVDFPLPPAEPLIGGDKDLISKYRALRRMAIQSADYDREQRAFKGELRSRRWTTDKPWHPSLLLGILYDVFADCGRSISRPASLWFLSVLAFAIFFVQAADQGGKGWAECVGRGDAPFFKSLYISGRNALVLSSGGKDDRITQAYHCLFGGADGKLSIPDGVSFVESFVQLPLSAVLIFLFLLAVKNRFKIK